MDFSRFGRTIVWGDSVARGVVYDETRRRYTISPKAAVKYFANEGGVPLTNRARMGMTSVDGMAQIEEDLSRGMTADTALIGFGGNDSDFDWQSISDAPEAEHLPKTSLAKYESTLCRMIRAIREKGMKIIMTNLPPVIAEKYFDFISAGGRSPENILRWLGTKERISSFHDEYSVVAERVAKKESCIFVDLYAAFSAHENLSALYCADGIHPNDLGQEVIARAVGEALATSV